MHKFGLIVIATFNALGLLSKFQNYSTVFTPVKTLCLVVNSKTCPVPILNHLSVGLHDLVIKGVQALEEPLLYYSFPFRMLDQSALVTMKDILCRQPRVLVRLRFGAIIHSCLLIMFWRDNLRLL
jgi:hypothetical protein